MEIIKIALDEERELRYNVNAMCDLEDSLGASMLELFEQKKVGFGFIRKLLYIGLKHGGIRFPKEMRTEHEREEGIGELIQEHWMAKDKTLEDLMKIIGLAFKAAGLGGAEDDKKEDEDEAGVLGSAPKSEVQAGPKAVPPPS